MNVRKKQALRAVALLAVVAAVLTRFVVPTSFEPEKNLERGYIYPLMTESGLAYSDLWGAFSSYVVVIAFIMLSVVLAVTRDK